MHRIINIENAEFNYRQDKKNETNMITLKDINLCIEEGEYVAAIGRNGSGKSTFAKLLNALLLPTKGVIYINNLKTSEEKNLWNIRQIVGMVFQNPDNQIVATTVEEDVAFGPENIGIPPEEIRVRVEESLNRVGLIEYRNTAPHNLSGGQKQRVAIAGILAMKPKCIVLDEATSMLDPIGRKEVLSVLSNLNKQEKITLIHITHHMEEAALANRILIIDGGSIVMDGIPSDIFTRVEELKNLGLDVPQITELFYELKKEGYDISSNILKVDDAVNYIKDYMAHK